jgi:hypothetical protein
MNIHKFGAQPEKPFHSNAYAQEANGESIGSTNAQTFGQRYHIERNRRAVRSYRDSYVGQGALQHRARTSNPLQRLDSGSARQSQNAKNPSTPLVPPRSSAPPRPTFKEPPTRGFNPFG